jgi:hypothetical protein
MASVDGYFGAVSTVQQRNLWGPLLNIEFGHLSGARQNREHNFIKEASRGFNRYWFDDVYN